MIASNILLAAGLAYLLGSIPSGAVIARLYGGVDLTVHGSGRTGATNVLRTLGPGAAAVVFAVDLLKGCAAVLLARWLSGGVVWVELLAAILAVIGHSYSVWLGFKGGRGVLTGLGATLVAAPIPMAIAVVVGATAIALTRFVSLGSVLGAVAGGISLIVYAAVSGEPAWAVWGLLIGGFIVISHRDNLGRLFAGTERKLGQRVEMRH